MNIKREFFGETKEGAPVYLYRLSNANAMEVTVLNYGVNIRNVFINDKNGVRRDVVLGYDNLDGYFDNAPTLGSTIGPNANRVSGASYSIDGKTFKLDINENGENNLHTDLNKGFHKRIWNATEKEDAVLFELEQEDGELGFAGSRKFSVEVKVTDDNEFVLHYHGQSDAKTLINPTNHTYFNLGGHDSGKVFDHIMQISAHEYTPVIDSKSIPTGEIANVEGTPMNFLVAKPIGQDFDDDFEQLKLTNGYDHNYCIDGAVNENGEVVKELRNFANVTNPNTGITMHCYSDLPGVQFYAGNFLNDIKGKEDARYSARCGFCLETQYYPDSINIDGFPKPVFGPENDYDSTTIYKFS